MKYHSEVRVNLPKGIQVSLKGNRFLSVFFFTHVGFAIILGRLFAFAPDEGGYLYTFNNLYGTSVDPNPQYNSGWITAPKIFLWIMYLPAKLLTVIGLPDYLSIRILSIILATAALYLMLDIHRHTKFSPKFTQKSIFIFFFIPSIFLWTSVGLRESFIILEIAAFLAGMNFLMQEKNKRAIILLFLGSYGLISTKNYLWACLMIAVAVSCCFFLFQGINRQKILKFLLAGLLVPVISFASTTSVYALNFIFNSDINAIGQRSGDSISQVYVELPGTGTGSKPIKELITFHGDYSLIALHNYLLENPKALFSRVLGVFQIDKEILRIWDEKIALGLVHKDKQVGSDTSSLNGHILVPGDISNPLSMIWPAFVFLCGPFPLVGNPGLAATISSFESPLWWSLYLLLIFQFIRFRKTKFFRDPQILFTLIFLVGEIAFSALVEVNLGTSFRHRSIILIPLVFVFLRLAQRAKELEDLNDGII
jgi:hypothetical protein